MEITEIALSDFSKISYLDMPKNLINKYMDYVKDINQESNGNPITLQEFSQAALLELDNYFKVNEDTGEYSQGDKYAISLLEKYSSEEYSSVKTYKYKI